MVARTYDFSVWGKDHQSESSQRYVGKAVSETLPIETGHFEIFPTQGGLSGAAIIGHIVKI